MPQQGTKCPCTLVSSPIDGSEVVVYNSRPSDHIPVVRVSLLKIVAVCALFLASLRQGLKQELASLVCVLAVLQREVRPLGVRMCVLLLLDFLFLLPTGLCQCPLPFAVCLPPACLRQVVFTLHISCPPCFRPTHTLAGVRVGEAKNPGPMRASSEPPMRAVRRRIRFKCPTAAVGRDIDVPQADALNNPVPPLYVPPEGGEMIPLSPGPTRLDSLETLCDTPDTAAASSPAMGVASGSVGPILAQNVAPPQQADPRLRLKPLLRLQVRREGATKSSLLSCSVVASKHAWRWQMRSQPMLNGTDSHTPSLALAAFIRTHGPKLEPASVELMNEHIMTLQSEDLAFADWMRSLKPPRHNPVIVAPPLSSGMGHAAQSDLTWAQLSSLQALHIPTLRYIPKGCVGLFLSVAVEMLSTAPCTGERPGPSELFLLLPKLVLPAIHPDLPPGQVVPRSRQKVTLAKLLMAQRGEWGSLYEQACACVSSKPQIDVDQDPSGDGDLLSDNMIDHILTKISRGSGVHAWSLAKSPGIAPLNAENLKEAERKLRPKGACSSPFAAGADPVSWTPADACFDEAQQRLKLGVVT